MPLGDHLEELRRRLVFALYGLIPLALVSLIVGRRILTFIMQPALDALVASGYSRFMTTAGPLEGFGSYVKVSLIVTLLVGSPFILTLPVFMYRTSVGYELQVASISALMLMVPGILLLVMLERYMKSEYLSMFGRV